MQSIAGIVDTIDGAWEKCLFAVAPDVFDPVAMKGDPVATIERSRPWLRRLRALGVPVALVYQDGLEDHTGLIPWDEFDCAFIGGSDAFKMGHPDDVKAGRAGYQITDRVCPITGEVTNSYATAEKTRRWARLIWETHERGKTLHVGRVNSHARWAFSRDIWAQSADGTAVAFGGQKFLDRLRKWYR